MREGDVSTLWRLSAFERQRAGDAEAGLGVVSALGTTLMSELHELQRRRRDDDLLEVVAACLRQCQHALLVVRHQDLVWPLTLYPERGLYHVPRPLIGPLHEGNLDLRVMEVAPAVRRPPSRTLPQEAIEAQHFQPLPPLLWTLAQTVPRPFLLPEIAGRAAYRLAPDFVPEPTMAAGALGPALRRLRTTIVPLRAMARWHGMDLERAVRLVNGVYLLGGLMVLRTHPAARADIGGPTAWLQGWRQRLGTHRS